MKSKKYIDDIILLVIIILAMASIILPIHLNNLDELWNYNFARNMADGKVPYRDFNIVQMPLFPMICSVFLNVFGNELIVMRILAIVLCSAIVFLVYKILEKLKIPSYVNILSILTIGYLFKDYFCIDYNFAVLLNTLIIVYIEITNAKKNDVLKLNIKSDLIIGALAGMSLCFKQSTGLILIVVMSGYKFLLVKNKQEFIEYIKILIARILGTLIPIIITVIYLIVNGAWDEFYSYSILGIRTFSNKISYINLIKSQNSFIKILSILVPITYIYLFFRTIVKTPKTLEDKTMYILFAYGIASFVVTFPISDNIHFLIGSLVTIIIITYMLWKCIAKAGSFSKIQNFWKPFCNVLFSSLAHTLVFLLIVYSIGVIHIYLNISDSDNDLMHFSYIPVSDGLKSIIKEVDDYILENTEKKVYILDATAAIYMIPIDRYNKDYDMFLKGNLGADGEEGQIEKIQNEKNAVFLIMQDGRGRNWQNPELVRKYIKENKTKVGELVCFDIYE